MHWSSDRSHLLKTKLFCWESVACTNWPFYMLKLGFFIGNFSFSSLISCWKWLTDTIFCAGHFVWRSKMLSLDICKNCQTWLIQGSHPSVRFSLIFPDGGNPADVTDGFRKPGHKYVPTNELEISPTREKGPLESAQKVENVISRNQ